jgi:hypothetical protein
MLSGLNQHAREQRQTGTEMPRENRDEKRARTARYALQWSIWLTEAMAEEGVRAYELVERAGELGAIFSGGNVSHWRDGDQRADADNAIVIAHILHRDPVEALDEAGHDVIANEMVDRVRREVRAIITAMRQDGHEAGASLLEIYAAEAIAGRTPNPETDAQARLKETQAKVDAVRASSSPTCAEAKRSSPLAKRKQTVIGTGTRRNQNVMPK